MHIPPMPEALFAVTASVGDTGGEDSDDVLPPLVEADDLNSGSDILAEKVWGEPKNLGTAPTTERRSDYEIQCGPGQPSPLGSGVTPPCRCSLCGAAGGRGKAWGDASWQGPMRR